MVKFKNKTMKKLLLIIALLISGIAFGQQAIEINGQIKIYNQIPNEWNTPDGVKIVNFRQSTEQERYDLGFRDLIQPTIGQYQKRDSIYFDSVNDVFTYAVKDFTQSEIDTYDQNQLDGDSSAVKIMTYKEDGEMWNKRIWDRIMREYDSGDLNNTQFNTISTSLFDATLPLYFGQWKIAKSRVDALPTPSNAKLLAILNKVKQIINDYINENY